MQGIRSNLHTFKYIFKKIDNNDRTNHNNYTHTHQTSCSPYKSELLTLTAHGLINIYSSFNAQFDPKKTLILLKSRRCSSTTSRIHMEKQPDFPSIQKQMQVHFEDRGSKLHVASKNAKLHCLRKQELKLKQMRGMLIHILKIKELLPTSIIPLYSLIEDFFMIWRLIKNFKSNTVFSADFD